MRVQKLTTSIATIAVMMTSYAMTVQAEDFPSKTIEVITHAGAGGGTDVTTRMMMLRSRRNLKQDMVVVNKNGGNGAAAMEYFKTLDPDGHTVLAFTIGHAITMAKGKTSLKVEDLMPLARGTDDPQILMVNCKESKYKTPEEFVEGMKTEKLKFGTTNVGGIDHISAYVFAKKAN